MRGSVRRAGRRTTLTDLGIDDIDLRLAPDQTWGGTHYTGGADGRLSIEVVGRDSTDAQFLAKLWRFVWYKDSGPTLSLTREHQVEHQAYVLFLANRTGESVTCSGDGVAS